MKKKLLITAILACTSAVAQAAGNGYTDTGEVVSVQPVYQDVHRQVCDQVQSQQPQATGERSILGAVIGGVAGGILGNQVGGGNGKTVATAAGAVTGALVGDRMGNQNTTGAPQSQTVCRNITEQQPAGFDVDYRYNGRIHTARLPRDPGRTVNIGVQAY